MKRYRAAMAIALLAAFCLSAAGQSYSIRVSYNTNIRAEPSLEGARLETVPAGTILEVTQKLNRWLRVNRGADAWMAGWVSHTRVEGAAAATTDNCCGIDRQCQHQNEWEAGYWAFQRGECAAPTQSTQTSQTGATNQTPTSAAGDNCCGVDRQCTTNQQWIDGYWAYQRGQCGAPAQGTASAGNCCESGWNCRRDHEFVYGAWAASHNRCFPTPNSLPPQSFGPYVNHGHIRISELTPGFATMVKAGFELLRLHAPLWYNYVVNAITEVRECHNCSSGVYGASGIIDYHHGPFSATKPYLRQDDYTSAEFFVHEACHVYQDREGRGVGGDLSWTNEYECELYNRDAALKMGGVSRNIGPNSVFLNDPMNRALWWWSP